MIGNTLKVNKFMIGNRIREVREERKLTQMKLAELADLSTITVSNMESGKFSPNLKNLIKISEVLGVSIDFLVKGKATNMNKAYIHEINIKLGKMDEKNLKHISQYIDLYTEMINER